MAKRKILLGVLAVLFCCARPVFSAEVYYLGGGGGLAAGQMNPSYPLGQRFKDLFDLSHYGDEKTDRSGSISGTLTESVSWQNVSGNRSKSFLENGTDYNNELNLNIQEKLWRDYNFEGQLFLRQTDDRRVEPRRDLRLKQLSLKVFNPNNMYEFGDFYGDFSPFTLSSSLEGLHADIKSDGSYTFQMVTARSKSPDVAADVFQRNVVGSKVDLKAFRSSEIFSNFRTGFQVVTSRDDSATITAGSSTRDLRNTVVGIDGEISLTKLLALNYEIARSAYLEDEDLNAVTVKDEKYGTAFRVQPSLNFGKLTTRYLYYYVQPGFYTDAGSAASDKIQHQINADYRFSPQATLNLMQNWYWDHLTNSMRTKRTMYDEKSASLTWRPFLDRTSLSLRPYLHYQVKDSDDLGNSAEGTTRTLGIALNDSLDAKTSYGVNYEYRSYTDEAAKTSSDYFNRVGFNLSRESQLFSRRLYQSIGPSVDFRRTKRDNDIDMTVSTAWTGQYDITKAVVARWGYNLQVVNSATALQDFTNHRNYLEADFLVSRKRSAHFIVRGERNHYDHEEGTQDYDETRVTGRFSVNF